MNDFLLKLFEFIRTGQMTKNEAAALISYLSRFPETRPSDREANILDIPTRNLFGALNRLFGFDYKSTNLAELWDFFKSNGISNKKDADTAVRRAVGVYDFIKQRGFQSRIVVPEEYSGKEPKNPNEIPKYDDDAILPAVTEDGKHVYITPFRMVVKYVNGLKMRYLEGGDYVEPHSIVDTLNEITELSTWTTNAGNDIAFNPSQNLRDENGNIISPTDIGLNDDFTATWAVMASNHAEEHTNILNNIVYDDKDPTSLKKALKFVKSGEVKFTIIATGLLLMIAQTIIYKKRNSDADLLRSQLANTAVEEVWGIKIATDAAHKSEHFVHSIEQIIDAYKLVAGGIYMYLGDLWVGYAQMSITLFLMSIKSITIFGETISMGNPLAGITLVIVGTLLGWGATKVKEILTEEQLEERRLQGALIGYAPGAYATHGLKIQMSQFGHILEVALHREFLRRQEYWDENGNIQTLDVVQWDWRGLYHDDPITKRRIYFQDYNWRADDILRGVKSDPTIWWDMPEGEYPIHFGQPVDDARERLKDAVKDDLNQKNKNNTIDPNLGRIPEPILDKDDLDFLVPQYPWGEPAPDWVPSFEDLVDEAIKNGYGDTKDRDMLLNYNNTMNSFAVDVRLPDGNIVPNLSRNDKSKYSKQYSTNVSDSISEKIIIDTNDSIKSNIPSEVEIAPDGKKIIKPSRDEKKEPEKPAKSISAVKEPVGYGQVGLGREQKNIPNKKEQTKKSPSSSVVVKPPTPNPTLPAPGATGARITNTGGKQLSAEDRFKERVASLDSVKNDRIYGTNPKGRANQVWNGFIKDTQPKWDGKTPLFFKLKPDGTVQQPNVPKNGGARNNAGVKKLKEREGDGLSPKDTGTQSGGGGVNTCFPAYSLVKIPTGYTRISELSVGDVVVSYDVFGTLVNSTITHVFIHDGLESSDVFRFTLSNGKKLDITENHPVLLLNGKYEQIGILTPNDFIVDEFGNSISIVSKTYLGNMAVYNLEVSEYHTYIADGIRVHNAIYKDDAKRRQAVADSGAYRGVRGPRLDDVIIPGPQSGGGTGETGGGETGGGTGETGGGETGGGKSLACFPSWVTTSTPNGLVEIKDIKLGDKIYAFDATGNLIQTEVSHYIHHTDKEKCEVFRYTLSNGINFDATENHGVLNVDNKFVAIGSVGFGECLVLENGDFVHIISKESIGILDVYNISTKNYGTYFANGIRVSGDWVPTKSA